MPTANKHRATEEGAILQRGGMKMPVEKLADRFTVIASTPGQVDQMRNLPGIRRVEPVTRQLLKVETTITARAEAMHLLRSDAFRNVVHPAYQPVAVQGTIYYITDKLIVSFKPQAADADIEAILERHQLVVLHAYDFRPNTFLLQVTTSSGANPLKIANRLAAETLVRSAEPNLVNCFQPMFVPDDPLFDRQWHLHAARGPQLVAKASVDAPEA